MTTQLQSEIFNAIGYDGALTSTGYSWTGTNPSAGIIAAVEALSADPNTVYSITDNHDDAADLQDLLDLLTQAQIDDFREWQYEQYCAACDQVLLSTGGITWMALKAKYLNKGPDYSGYQSAVAALEAVNLTRPLMDGGISADPPVEAEEE